MLICILCIGFFVTAKFSFTRLRRNPIDTLSQLKKEDEVFMTKLYHRPSLFIYSVQFFILTLTLIFSYISYGLVNTATEIFTVLWGWPEYWEHILAFIVVILISATILLSFGEMVPKSLGLSYSESLAPSLARVVVFVARFIYPFVSIALFISRKVLKLFKTNLMTEIDLIHSEDEIRALINMSHKGGAINKEETELIDNVFDFVTRLAKEVMIPRQEVVCLYTDDSYEDNMKVVRESKHSRYPLCEGDKDHIIGLIHVKDLMENAKQAQKDLRLIRREILVVSEVMKLSSLLQYMRTQRTYQSVVVDEYGGMVGLVGLEDIVEELVGDIQDEHAEEREQIVALGDGTYDFDGTVLVDDVEDLLHIEISDAEEDTIGGFLFGQIGRTPEMGDFIECNGYEFTVTELQGYRVSRVFVRPLPPTIEEDTEVGKDGAK